MTPSAASHRLIISILFFCSLIFFNYLAAQQGAWVSQNLPASMSGAHLADRGETCVGYTRPSSQYVYFFDINVSQWTEVDLGSQQTMRDLEASGQTVMAYSDDFIVGYSAITSQWDTLSYQGTLLDPTGTGIQRSYGCGDSLAYFVTDQYFYVFDAKLGAWKSYAYTYPGATLSAWFWSGDDYAGVIFNQNLPNYPVNMVYSLPQHAFNINLQGGYYYHTDWGMNHGFVTLWGDAASTHIITGYSSLSNQFSQRTILAAPGHFHGCYCGFPDHYLEKTIAIYTLRESQDEVRFYAYDTRQGHWSEASHYFSHLDYTGIAGWAIGGRAGAASQHNLHTNEMTYITFSGITAGFNTWRPGLYYSGSIGASANGAGNFVVAFDTTNIWFFNPQTQSSHTIPMPWSYPTGWYLGENYATMGSYAWQGGGVEMHIYNSTTDQITNISAGRNTNVTVLGSPYLCGFTAGQGLNEVYLYSALLDDYTAITYPVNSYPGISVGNYLAVVNHSSQSYLYDATRNTTIPTNYILNSGGLGGYTALFKKNDYAVGAYTVLSGQWSEFAIPEGIYLLRSEGYIGLIGTLSAEKYYAYNGYYHNLVELDPPSGLFVSALTGGKTALVAKESIAYAFDPQAPTGFGDGQPPTLVKDFHLAQNYPNPFNPVTNVEFAIPNSQRVSLAVYDILGRKVATLIDERRPAGSYRVTWDGRNNGGELLSSGVYFYRLDAGPFAATLKMLLLK